MSIPILCDRCSREFVADESLMNDTHEVICPECKNDNEI